MSIFDFIDDIPDSIVPTYHCVVSLPQHCIDFVTERLRNTEDKLEAAENTKKIMHEEMRSYEETKEKMSSDLEVKVIDVPPTLSHCRAVLAYWCFVMKLQ